MVDITPKIEKKPSSRETMADTMQKAHDDAEKVNNSNIDQFLLAAGMSLGRQAENNDVQEFLTIPKSLTADARAAMENADRTMKKEDMTNYVEITGKELKHQMEEVRNLPSEDKPDSFTKRIEAKLKNTELDKQV